MHPGQVQDQAAVDGVSAAGQPGTGAAYDDGDTEVGADTDGVLHVGLDAGTQGNDWQPHGRPLGLVVGQAREDRGVDHEVLLRNPLPSASSNRAGRGSWASTAAQPTRRVDRASNPRPAAAKLTERPAVRWPAA